MKDFENENLNNNVTNNDEDLPNIIVTYYTKNEILFQRQFPKSVIFDEIMKEFEKNFKGSNNIEYFYKNNSVNRNQRVIDVIDSNEQDNSKLLEIELTIQFHFNDLDQNIEQLNYSKILKPQSNPFRLIIYSPKDSKITIEKYPKEKNIQYELNKYDDSSAYCDSPDYLYISGGEKHGKPIKNFWRINHQTYIADLSYLPSPKRGHSMIYIPNNYVFFVGGSSKETFYYNIKNHNFSRWADMNGEHIEPALCLLNNNTLYAFSQILEDKNYFEKTELNQFPIWEKINVKNNNFNLRFFSAIPNNKNEIILYGGSIENDKGNVFKFNPENNNLELFNDMIMKKLILMIKIFIQSIVK